MADSTPIKASQLHPDLRSSYRFLPHVPVLSDRVLKATRPIMTAVPAPKLLDGIRERQIHTVAISGQQVRVFIPETRSQKPTRALLWLHGGGMVVGAAVQDDLHCMLTCAATGSVVISADYRLAPEHTFPAHLDDCEAAWLWALEHAEELGVDKHNIAVGGESAGGGLAAALVQKVHDRGGTQPVAQWLFCPMLDDRTAADTTLDDYRHFVWDNRINRASWAMYLGTTDSPPEYAAPARRQDLSGLPPAWIGVGTLDLFLEEAATYARSMAKAGVDVTLDTVHGAPHAFEAIALHAPVSVAYRKRATDWLYYILNP